MKSAYIKSLGHVIFKPLTMRHLPIHFQLEPSTYCNLNCVACTRSKFLNDSRHLNVGDFKTIIEQIRPAKITLSGSGEPFMHPQLFDMIQMAKALGSSINSTTNCTLFTPELCEQIVKSGLDLLKISIDAATAETYQLSRREDRFSQVTEGIRTLVAAKKRLGSPTPFLRFNYVIFRENYREIAETIQLASELEVDAIYFQPLGLTGIEERSEALVGDLSYESLKHEILRALEMGQRYPGVKTNLRILLKLLPLYWKKYQLSPFQNERRICILPWFSTYLTVDGNVHPCCTCSEPNTIMGNIFETPFSEIWNGHKYQNFRRAIRAGKRPFAVCQNCVPQTLPDILKISQILPGFLSQR